MLRLEGLFGPVTLRGAGRDLLTPGSDEAVVADSASVIAHVAFVDGRTLTDITSEPALPSLAGLIGTRVSSGFRGQLDHVAPELRVAHSVLYQLLDDLPVATLVSGYVLSAAEVIPRADVSKYQPSADMCSGWRSGGTIMLEIEQSGTVPVVTGPIAPPLVDPDDAHGWHPTERLPAHSMRRARRLDVWREPDGSLAADSLFRDSYVDDRGAETVIHEYTVVATVDPTSMTVINAMATSRALPWVECPVAVASAGRLAGHPAQQLRSIVRSELSGISTCTHLNDQLRSLADVPALSARLV